MRFNYFLTVPGNEDLLKEEIRLYYPDLKFAYSRPGFCTFKNEKDLPINDVIYSLTWGNTISRLKISELDLTDYEGEFSFLQTHNVKDENSWIPKHKNVDNSKKYDVIRTNNDEVFVCERFNDKWNSPFQRDFSEKKEVISRAYYKASDAFKMFNISNGLKVLELGSVPGGITQFLLENDHLVDAVDPGVMDERVLKNQNLRFFKKPVQDFKPPSDQDYEILVSDMNLKPKIVLEQCGRILKEKTSINQVFITLKTSSVDLIGKIPTYKKMMNEMALIETHFLQLPKHKREFLAYGKKIINP